MLKGGGEGKPFAITLERDGQVSRLSGKANLLLKCGESAKATEIYKQVLADRDVIWAMQLDGRISYVSPAVEQVRGVTQAEARRV